jgi:glycogen synthase
LKHLLICREYPPAPSGGIGTYASCVTRLLAESGETVHVIGQAWRGAEKPLEEHCHGRLVVHRVPYESWTSFLRGRPNPSLGKGNLVNLFYSGFPARCFSWQASLLAETLVEEEAIDIVEAQDYEAPLCYFQLRRAMGLGPRRQPPCFVHLHSPSESIARHNGWSLRAEAVVTAGRLEDYSATAADALLCPSRFLAGEVQSRLGLSPGRICVAPYPVGDAGLLDRNQRTWERGTICYVGRLEPRKGVLEWIEAAVAAAREFPDARFDFVGSNALGPNRIAGEETLRRLVPRDLEHRFLFRGSQNRSCVGSFLRAARMAVVPSRWENFPYSCIEAMASGLPVIATREGGMAEMIRDGRTGWLAAEPTSAGLEQALRRALAEPGTRLSEMGHQAALDIGALCGNAEILGAQLEFRRRVVDKGPGRSLSRPPNVSRLAHDEFGSLQSAVPVEMKTRRKRPFHEKGWFEAAAYGFHHPYGTARWLLGQLRSRWFSQTSWGTLKQVDSYGSESSCKRIH